MKRILLSVATLLALALPVSGQDIPLSQILVEKEGWREVADWGAAATFLQSEAGGSIYIFQGKDVGRLTLEKRIQKAESRLYEFSPSLILGRSGLYVIREMSGQKTVAFSTPGEKDKTLKISSLKSPSCLTLWPDEGHLVIGESDGAYLWAVRIEKDGSLGSGDRYYSLRTAPNQKMHVTAMTMDAKYLLYACTPLGVQVFDPTGRLSGVIASPSKEPMTAITIGGANADELFVAAGNKIYARRIQGKAAFTLKK